MLNLPDRYVCREKRVTTNIAVGIDFQGWSGRYWKKRMNSHLQPVKFIDRNQPLQKIDFQNR